MKLRAHDPVYYLPEGNIVILVEDVLFKVHGSTLTQDSSIFGSMLSLPHPEAQSNNREGESDDNPIILHGETVARFRTLLWALYALPHEIAKLYVHNADIGLLVNIASVAQKYTFEKVESWAADLMLTKLKSRQRQYPADYDFLPMLEYAILSDKIPLRDKVLDIVRVLVKADGIDLSRLIDFADGKDQDAWKNLLGFALHEYVMKGPHRWETDGNSLPKDKRTLLYVAFAKLCDMRVFGVPWDHICTDVEKCVTEFRGRLHQSLAGYSGDQADFIAWTRYIASIYPPDSDSCLDVGMVAMQAQARSLEERPWTFFSEMEW